MTGRCDTCNHWYVRSPQLAIADQLLEGECRHSSPQIIDETHYGVWPITLANAFCSEFDETL